MKHIRNNGGENSFCSGFLSVKLFIFTSYNMADASPNTPCPSLYKSPISAHTNRVGKIFLPTRRAARMRACA